MSEILNTGTAEGLVAFLDWVADKGLMNRTTAAARKSAASKVLEIDGDGWEAQDIRKVDVDGQIERFQRLSSSRYTPGSLRTYGQRFRDGVASYLEYLANPAGFRGSPGRPRAASRQTKKEAPADRVDAGTGEPSGSELITFPFPLSSGRTAYLQLPRDLVGVDARRIARFVEALAVDEQQGA